MTVYGRTPNPRWQPPRVQGGRETPRPSVDVNTTSDGVIEVVDRRSGTVLSRLSTDEVYLPVAGSERLAQVNVALPSGEIELRIVEVRLVRR